MEIRQRFGRILERSYVGNQSTMLDRGSSCDEDEKQRITKPAYTRLIHRRKEPVSSP